MNILMIIGIVFFAVLDYVIIDKVLNYHEPRKKFDENYNRRITNNTTYQTKHKI